MSRCRIEAAVVKAVRAAKKQGAADLKMYFQQSVGSWHREGRQVVIGNGERFRCATVADVQQAVDEHNAMIGLYRKDAETAKRRLNVRNT
jgi:hypothetical protein